MSDLNEAIATNRTLLLGLWQEILTPPEPITDESDFFQLGGDSLQMMTMLYRLEQHTGVEVSPGSIFEHPTLGQLAQFLATEQDTTEAPMQTGTI